MTARKMNRFGSAGLLVGLVCAVGAARAEDPSIAFGPPFPGGSRNLCIPISRWALFDLKAGEVAGAANVDRCLNPGQSRYPAGASCAPNAGRTVRT